MATFEEIKKGVSVYRCDKRDTHKGSKRKAAGDVGFTAI